VTRRLLRRLRPLRRVGAGFAATAGFALTELLTVLVILTIVLGGLTALFVSATTAEVDMRERFEAQQEARLAIDALRREVHCASAITQTGPSPTVTLTLPAGCPSGSGSVTWCTVSAGTDRYRLYRKVGTSCDATGKLYADYLRPDAATSCPPNMCVFSYAAPTATTRAKLHVEVPVDTEPEDSSAAYKLTDDLVLRNTNPTS
jgi:type II secretory pathway pseudopilin PulG